MQQLLASVGSKATEDTMQVEATEYNWHQPHCFNGEQLKKLDSFTEEVAREIAEKFTQLCRSDFDVTITSTTQHFADEFLNLDNEQSDYRIAFGVDQEHPFGLIAIPIQSAITWTTQVLGDAESGEDSSRKLSQLEESLLLDIASAFIEAFSKAYDDYDLHPAKSIVRDQLPFELQGTEELCKITFGVKKTESENSDDAYFLILCEKLEPAAAKNIQTSEDFSAEDISKAILDYVQTMPVSVTAQLASTVLTLEEIISLHVDDILLLNKSVNEQAELIIEGKTLLRGRPAKSHGKHAVVITELCSTK